MSRRAARAKLCPTPSKGRYYDAADAATQGRLVEAQLLAAHLPVRPFYVYPCACLYWHLTGHAYNRDGVPNQRANA